MLGDDIWASFSKFAQIATRPWDHHLSNVIIEIIVNFAVKCEHGLAEIWVINTDAHRHTWCMQGTLCTPSKDFEKFG